MVSKQLANAKKHLRMFVTKSEFTGEIVPDGEAMRQKSWQPAADPAQAALLGDGGVGD
jgi:hypothetical protein